MVQGAEALLGLLVVDRSDLVIYESRLELACLLFAGFDVSVRHISAQPFLLEAEVAGAVRKHIPDYLLATDAGPLVVDVKPQHRATTRRGKAWPARRAVRSSGRRLVDAGNRRRGTL